MEAVVLENVCTGTSGVSYILFSIQKAEQFQAEVGMFIHTVVHLIICKSSVNPAFCFTEKRPHHDPDDDSGMGPSTFTDTKSTTFSEVCYSHTYCVLHT